MAQRHLHATTLGRRRVRARVVLAGGPSLLHAGRVVQPLGLVVVIARPLATVHAVLPAHPGVRHLVHVRRGAPQQSTMKEGNHAKRKHVPVPSVAETKPVPLGKIKGKMKEKSGHDREKLARSEAPRGQLPGRSFIQRRAKTPPDQEPRPPAPGRIRDAGL